MLRINQDSSESDTRTGENASPDTQVLGATTFQAQGDYKVQQSAILFVIAAALVGFWAVIQVTSVVKSDLLPKFVVEGRKLVFVLGVVCAIVAAVIYIINKFNIS
jgi:hypothetical protein